MAQTLTSSSITTYSGIRTTLPGQINSQAIPTSRVQHFAPTNIGAVGGQLNAFQLMNGAITGSAVTSAPALNVWVAPTASNVLQAYSGNTQKVQVGDVFKVLVFNTGTTGLIINSGISTGATGSFVLAPGTTNGTLQGSEGLFHINWLQVSQDGNSGVYLSLIHI